MPRPSGSIWAKASASPAKKPTLAQPNTPTKSQTNETKECRDHPTAPSRRRRPRQVSKGRDGPALLLEAGNGGRPIEETNNPQQATVWSRHCQQHQGGNALVPFTWRCRRIGMSLLGVADVDGKGREGSLEAAEVFLWAVDVGPTWVGPAWFWWG